MLECTLRLRVEVAGKPSVADRRKRRRIEIDSPFHVCGRFVETSYGDEVPRVRVMRERVVRREVERTDQLALCRVRMVVEPERERRCGDVRVREPIVDRE